jgi:hypothetical protein
VLDLTPDGKVRVRFTGRPDDVLLTADGAGVHLRLDDAEWQEGPKARKGRGKAARPVPCITCGKDLRQAYTYAQSGWRACPQCSGKDGRQHVLYPFPQGFEGADANAAPGGPARAGWCLACRTDGAVSAGTAKVCSDFER